MTLPDEKDWERVEELAATMEDLSPEAKAKRLAELAAEGEAATILSLLSTWLALPAPAAPFDAGDFIGKQYTLREKLGEGGMGSVWRATQKLIQRDVALKMIHPALVSPALCERFAGEMEILGKLEHPGIVKIYDAGIAQHEDGREIPFFAMELVDGAPLRYWASERREDRGALLRAMAGVCAAVHHAHDRQIVHRDLKPANIMVRRNGQPVVLDFGVARLAGGGPEEPQGAFSGTPQYAAPEQHLGRDRDFRSGESVDVYAVGAILFEVMSGRRLFEFPRGASIAEMRSAILDGTPPRLAEALPECPPLLDEIAARAVRRDPADRYYSISAFARALTRAAELCEGTPKPAAPPWSPATAMPVPGTNWILTTKLGEGSTGEVWAAEHEQLQERRVFKFCDSEDKARTLKRELTLFRLLKERVGRNPHFIQLHEVSLEEPPWYLMMEYAEARDLEAWAAARPGGLEELSVATCVELMAQAAEALQSAHEAGILHRDIKPANLLVQDTLSTEDGAGLHVLLADFGIGQIVADELLRGGTRGGFTRTVGDLRRSTFSGTMLYMAPEVLEGAEATARSDIYSLGVVLWQLLAGNLHAALDPADWTGRIADPLLCEDLRRCLAGVPERRWSSAAEFAASLRVLPARRAKEARRQAELAERERAAYRRGVLRTAAVAGAVALLLLGAGWYSFNRSAAAAAAQADARTKTLGAVLSELGKLSMDNAANRTEAAQSVLARAHPVTDDDDRRVANAYAPILERDDWRVSEGSRREPAIRAAIDQSGQFALQQSATGVIYLIDQTRPGSLWKKDSIGNDGALAVSPHAKTIAIAVQSEIQIMAGTSGTITNTIRAATPALALAWRPDGLQLAVGRLEGEADGVIDLYDAPDWHLERTLSSTESNPFSRRPSGLAYSPDGTLLAHWSEDSQHLLIWHPVDGKLAAFAYHPAPVVAVAWTNSSSVPHQPTIYTAAADAVIYGWNLAGQQGDAVALDVAALRLPARGTGNQGHYCQWVRLSSLEEGRYLAAADEAGIVSCFDLGTEEIVSETPSGSRILALSGAGQQLVVSRGDGSTEFLERIRSSVERTYSSLRIGPIEDYDIVPAGTACACAGKGGLAVFFDEVEETKTKSNKTGESIPDPGSYCRGVRFIAAELLICSERAGDQCLSIAGNALHSPSFSPVNAFLAAGNQLHDKPARIALDAEKKHLVTGRSGLIRWSPFPGGPGNSVQFPEGAPEAIAISPDGGRVAWVDSARHAWLWTNASGAPTLTPATGVDSVAFIGNQQFAASGADGAQVFDATKIEQIPIAGLELSQAVEIAVQEKGSLGAVALAKGGIEIGMLEHTSGLRWHPLLELGTREKGSFSHLRFAGTDRWIGATTRNGSLHVWDLASLHRELEKAFCLPANFVVPNLSDFTPPIMTTRAATPDSFETMIADPRIADCPVIPIHMPLCDGGPWPEASPSGALERQQIEFLAVYTRLNALYDQLEGFRNAGSSAEQAASAAELQRAIDFRDRLEDRYAAVGFYAEPVMEGHLANNLVFHHAQKHIIENHRRIEPLEALLKVPLPEKHLLEELRHVSGIPAETILADLNLRPRPSVDRTPNPQ